MKKNICPKKLIPIAILLTTSTIVLAQAQFNVNEYIPPNNSVSVGLGYQTGDDKDHTILNSMTGTRDKNFYGFVDIDYLNRNNEGLVTGINAKNLGLRTYGFILFQSHQGIWEYKIDIEGLTKSDPRDAHTLLKGAGTNTPVVKVTPAAPYKTGLSYGNEFKAKVDRQRYGVTANYRFSPETQVEIGLRKEEKTGSRIWGVIGANATYDSYFMPEPIDSETTVLETKVNYVTKDFATSGGYYGSFYNNKMSAINATAPAGNVYRANGTTAAAGSLSPIALPPDNKSNTLFWLGRYSISEHTKLNFKLSYNELKQDEKFTDMGLGASISTLTQNGKGPGGKESLDGKITNTSLVLGLNAKPLTNLHITTTLKYSDKKDSTPIVYWNLTTPRGKPMRAFANNPSDVTKTHFDVEGGYWLLKNTKAVLGFDMDKIERSKPNIGAEVAGTGMLRAKNTETTWKAEIKQTWSPIGLTGSLAYSIKNRKGSDWYNKGDADVADTPRSAPDALGNIDTAYVLNLRDRKREKINLSLGYSPIESLSFQLNNYQVKDKFGETTSYGVAKNKFGGMSLDIDYQINDSYSINAYISKDENKARVQHHTESYTWDLTGVTDSYGLGFTGKVSSKISLGANYSFVKDITKYDQLRSKAVAGGYTYADEADLPNTTYKSNLIKLWGQYGFNKKSAIRIEALSGSYKYDDWAWGYNGTPFSFSDGTTITIEPNQRVNAIKLNYIYNW